MVNIPSELSETLQRRYNTEIVDELKRMQEEIDKLKKQVKKLEAYNAANP